MAYIPLVVVTIQFNKNSIGSFMLVLCVHPNISTATIKHLKTLHMVAYQT